MARDVKFKRINTNSLSSVPSHSGDTLKGEHLSILKNVIARAVNDNKIDSDQLYTGSYTDVITIYDVNNLENAVQELPEGGYIVLYNDNTVVQNSPQGILIYKKEDNNAVFKYRISLIDIMERIIALEDKINE